MEALWDRMIVFAFVVSLAPILAWMIQEKVLKD